MKSNREMQLKYFTHNLFNVWMDLFGDDLKGAEVEKCKQLMLETLPKPNSEEAQLFLSNFDIYQKASMKIAYDRAGFIFNDKGWDVGILKPDERKQYIDERHDASVKCKIFMSSFLSKINTVNPTLGAQLYSTFQELMNFTTTLLIPDRPATQDPFVNHFLLELDEIMEKKGFPSGDISEVQYALGTAWAQYQSLSKNPEAVELNNTQREYKENIKNAILDRIDDYESTSPKFQKKLKNFFEALFYHSNLANLLRIEPSKEFEDGLKKFISNHDVFEKEPKQLKAFITHKLLNDSKFRNHLKAYPLEANQLLKNCHVSKNEYEFFNVPSLQSFFSELEKNNLKRSSTNFVASTLSFPPNSLTPTHNRDSENKTDRSDENKKANKKDLPSQFSATVTREQSETKSSQAESEFTIIITPPEPETKKTNQTSTNQEESPEINKNPRMR